MFDDVDEGVNNNHGEATIGNQKFSADLSARPKGKQSFNTPIEVQKPHQLLALQEVNQNKDLD